MLTVGRQCVEHHRLLLDLHLAHDDQLHLLLLLWPLHVKLLSLSAA